MRVIALDPEIHPGYITLFIFKGKEIVRGIGNRRRNRKQTEENRK